MRKKKEEREKSQGKNIMVCPISYGDHNESGVKQTSWSEIELVMEVWICAVLFQIKLIADDSYCCFSISYANDAVMMDRQTSI